MGRRERSGRAGVHTQGRWAQRAVWESGPAAPPPPRLTFLHRTRHGTGTGPASPQQRPTPSVTRQAGSLASWAPQTPPEGPRAGMPAGAKHRLPSPSQAARASSGACVRGVPCTCTGRSLSPWGRSPWPRPDPPRGKARGRGARLAPGLAKGYYRVRTTHRAPDRPPWVPFLPAGAHSQTTAQAEDPRTPRQHERPQSRWLRASPSPCQRRAARDEGALYGEA